jgi:starch synthase
LPASEAGLSESAYRGRDVGSRALPSVRRVLFVNENLGGHATMHLHLRRVLAAEHPEIEATFLDVPPPGFLRRLAAVSLPGLDRLDADLQALRYQAAQSITVRRRLRRALLDHDAVHVYSQNVALLSASLLRAMPSIVSTDTTNMVTAFQLPHRRPGRFTRASLRPAMAMERRLFSAATLVVGQSDDAARQLGAYGVPPDRIRVIPFGITIGPAQARSRRPGLPRITFIGSTMERKGGFMLLQAFQESLRHRCRLTLVTRERVPPAPGVEVISDAKPADGVVARLLADTAVFALPSEIDKSPYAVLEAMAAGVPVVATEVGAIPEMVPEGVAGILIRPGDRRALVAAIETLLADEEKRRRMGDAARRHVLARFDARRTTRDLLAALEEARLRDLRTG